MTIEKIYHADVNIKVINPLQIFSFGSEEHK